MNVYYTIYQVTNLISGKFYVGMHQTKNLNDGYMGSGKYIVSAIKKHGIENFKKEILWLCSSFEEMKDFEKGCITEEFLETHKDKIYNLLVGGKGGFYYLNKTRMNVYENHRDITENSWRKKGTERVKELSQNNQEWRVEKNKKTSLGLIKHYETHHGHMMGRKQTPEAVLKQKKTFADIGHSQGDKNSQFGKCWIYNSTLKESKSIKKEYLLFWIEQGWCKGRKIYPRVV
jgi:hypothetical protein